MTDPEFRIGVDKTGDRPMIFVLIDGRRYLFHPHTWLLHAADAVSVIRWFLSHPDGRSTL